MEVTDSINPSSVKQRGIARTNDPGFLPPEVDKGHNYRMAEPCSFFAGGYRCCVCLSTRARRRLYVSFEQQLSRARRKLGELAYVQ
jgi:hypothetical protein